MEKLLTMEIICGKWETPTGANPAVIAIKKKTALSAEKKPKHYMKVVAKIAEKIIKKRFQTPITNGRLKVVSKITNDAKSILGKREGKEPENELDHFITCASCGQSIDMRDLGQVFHHEGEGHERIDIDS